MRSRIESRNKINKQNRIKDSNTNKIPNTKMAHIILIVILFFSLTFESISCVIGFGNFLTTTKIHQSVQINFHFKVYSLGAIRESQRPSARSTQYDLKINEKREKQKVKQKIEETKRFNSDILNYIFLLFLI